MIRRSLVIFPAVLCLACVVLWFRSLKISDELTLLTHADTNYVLATHPHGIHLYTTTNFRSHPPTWNPVSPDPPKEGWSYSHHPWGEVIMGIDEGPLKTIDGSDRITLAVQAFECHWLPPDRYIIGLGYESSASSWPNFNGVTVTQRRTTVALPFWLIVLLTAVPSLLVLRGRFIRRRRLRTNRCVSCGYDLRSSPERCPECGEIPPTSGNKLVRPAY